MEKWKIKVQFDNGGGVTLQAECGPLAYSHHYATGTRAGEDVKAILSRGAGCNPNHWDGNEWNDGMRAAEHPSNDAFLSFDSDATVAEVAKQFRGYEPRQSHNVNEFLTAIEAGEPCDDNANLGLPGHYDAYGNPCSDGGR